MRDSDAPFRAAAVALLRQLPGVVSAEDVGEPTGSEPPHDVDVQLTSGQRVAVEVTRAVDPEAMATFDGFNKHGGELNYDGSGRWIVYTAGVPVNIKTLGRELPPLLRELEELGLDEFDGATWYHPPTDSENRKAIRKIFGRLRELNVDQAQLDRTDSPAIQVWEPAVTGWASTPRAIEELKERIASKRAKFPVPGYDQGWLLVWMEWTLPSSSAVASDDWWQDPQPLELEPHGSISRVLLCAPARDEADNLVLRQYREDEGWTERPVAFGPVLDALRTDRPPN